MTRLFPFSLELLAPFVLYSLRISLIRAASGSSNGPPAMLELDVVISGIGSLVEHFPKALSMLSWDANHLPSILANPISSP